MKKRLLFIAVGLTLVSLGLGIFFPKTFYLFEAKWVDQYFRLRGAQPPQTEIVLATIDEKSLTQLGRWPWPRSTMARLVEQLKNYGVRAVGFDITFAEPSPEDEALAKSLRQTKNTFLGYFFYLSKEEVEEAALQSKEIKENEQSIFASRLNLSSKQLENSGKKVYGVQANVLPIAQASNGAHQGFFNIFPDEDGVIRWLPLALYYQNQAYPSLSLQLASFAADYSPIPVYDNAGALQGLALGSKKIPLRPSGEFFINYRGPAKTFPHLSIADILAKTLPAQQLKDKIVLIGATAIGIYDLRLTPFSTNLPGLEIQANVLDNLLAGDFLKFNVASLLLSWLLVVVVGLLFGITLPYFRALSSTFVFLGITLLLLAAGYFSFTQYYFILPVAKPVGNGCLVFGVMTIYRFFTEEKERRKIRKTFQHYLSPAIIKEALEHPEKLKLGGERKELTVLYSDIRDFTPKSEKLPPEQIVQLLNDYFTVMTEIVFKYEGTLDKFMGDAIMAIYGAPLSQTDHPLRASLTALEMIEQVNKHKSLWCQKYGLDDFKIGIGIHTGPMAVGNMGSLKRFNYTVIGDAVNLGSRLEALTKEYLIPIIISDAHYQLVKDHIIAKELGVVKVKGKQESTIIYELVGQKEPSSFGGGLPAVALAKAGAPKVPGSF